MADEKIKNITLFLDYHNWDLIERFHLGIGRVPLNWSWELEEDRDMPVEAFLLYIENEDFIEMRQIYIARRCRKMKKGTTIMRRFEEEHKGKLVHIYVRFTDHDPDNIFHDFLVSQGYKPDKEQPDKLWVKQL